MIKNRTRILQIINSAKIGGGTKHIYDLITNLDRKKYDFHIAISADGPYLEIFQNLGFEVHPVDMMSGKFQKTAIKDIHKIITELKPDIIHSHGTRAAFFLARYIKQCSAVPFIYTVHGLSYNRNAGLWVRVFYRQVERFICNKADIVISVSGTDGEEMVLNEIVRKEKLRVIPNGIDPQKFARKTERRKPLIPVGTITRLTEQKGIKFLIEAIAILRHSFGISPRVMIAGDGPLAGQLKKLSLKYGVAEQIDWLGAIDDSSSVYKKIGMFVLPSLWEGFPLVLIEAMACSLPVITTDTSGGRDIIIDGKNGLLVPRGNPEALALAIKDCLDNKSLANKLATAGEKTVNNKFTLEKFIRATERVYQDILRTGKDRLVL